MKTWFQSNPFWRDEEKTEAMTIYCTQVEGQEIEYHQQPVAKLLPHDGSINPLWVQLMKEIGPELIDKNTDTRHKEKLRTQNEEQLKTDQRKKSEKLEALFSMKLRAFEIQEVRECNEQFLRTKVRSSKTEVEMQAWVSVILMKSLDQVPDAN